jgi:hypothetical protein
MLQRVCIPAAFLRVESKGVPRGGGSPGPEPDFHDLLEFVGFLAR